MKVYQLRILIDELKNTSLSLKAPLETRALKLKMDDLLDRYEEEEDVTPEMVRSLKGIINQFWKGVLRIIPCEQRELWTITPFVEPWLKFQCALASAGLLEADFHHLGVHQELQNYYTSLSVKGDPLNVNKLIPLIICAARMLGYAENHELENYPFSKLSQKISANRPQEIEKIEDIMFLLRTLFYLMHKHCTVEQIALLPSLIHFRYPTTDEERRSELAIFNWLTQQVSGCAQFFSTYDRFINMRSIREIDALHHITDLLPTGRRNYLKATDTNRWIYSFIAKFRCEPLFEKDNEEAIEETIRLLKVDFSSNRDNSLSQILDFANSVKNQERLLPGWEAKIVHAALYAFCMEKYTDQFAADKHPKDTFSARCGWELLKCNAAEKRKLAAASGKPVKLGFFESLAANQGRLKKLIDFLEANSDMGDTGRCIPTN
ncbi:hypothetical protein OQJ18_08405 [Fluoribacter dumoffii]|uniref:Uncharacterized protein n=1 Tax=Fluoribacter dumoffii TaxID=463 RepID=A0A377G8P7_9GAMM|nr:hypothetical protein [Fluoribacter dumoffii]KTC89627.1 hypothetical protein Ldum_0695 [Fluoribacter dumoffii NY 23]MCW8384820.1 hypothetical protein [Fluoribacter dumoffii]MCW8417883.1 hypothetical protein [Fluoribacter dumoffii]MCW8454275.1 hypothetical protein [Fluoribacter dumoffii]MCW8461651.1 hypothetical protein [Fluoribacter dumoffii]